MAAEAPAAAATAAPMDAAAIASEVAKMTDALKAGAGVAKMTDALKAGAGPCVGIDFGISCVVASAPADDSNAVTVHTNDESGRGTPATVSFEGKQRHVGTAADGRIMSAPKQTLSHLPLTLGNSAAVAKRAERFMLGYGLDLDGTDGARLGPVSFNDEDYTLTPCGPVGVLIKRLLSYAVEGGPAELAVAVYDYFDEAELAKIKDALAIAGLKDNVSLLRHTDALAAAFAHNKGAGLLGEGVESRIVAFVDIGLTHGTVAVVKYVPAAEGSPYSASAEFLFRKSDESIGVQSFIEVIFKEAASRIEQKHKCKVPTKGRQAVRLANEATRALKQLSMLPDTEFALECYQPEGSDGPEIDVNFGFTRDALEAGAKTILDSLAALLKEAMATSDGNLEAVELVGGGSRIPAVQALITEAAGEAPLRFGLDGSSCVATGAAAWAAGKKVCSAMPEPSGGLSEEELGKVRTTEEQIQAIHAEELKRLEQRNALEGYFYQVRGWIAGKDGSLLNPSEMEPVLDKVQLWFEDAEYADEPTSLEAYTAKLDELKVCVQEKGKAYFDKKVKDKEDLEKDMEKAAEEERQRRKDLGMDFDKDERHMKKEDRLRLAAKNKDEGNDMFKAQKYDDAIRRYKKAIDHVSRPEAMSNFTPDEAEEARKIKASSHLNSAQCYIKGAEVAAKDGPNKAEPFYKKAKTSCDDVISLDDSNIKGLYRRAVCSEKLGDLDGAMKDVKKGLSIDAENADLKKFQERLLKLLQRQKDQQKKVYGKMFG